MACPRDSHRPNEEQNSTDLVLIRGNRKSEKCARPSDTNSLPSLSLVCSPWGRVSCVNNNKEELRGEQKDTPGGGSCAHFPPN